MNSEAESHERRSLESPAIARYIVITPVRDEGHLIAEMIQSVAAQTVRPLQWIIVNDGSQDDTGPIIDRYAKEYSWIAAVHRTDRGFREPGTGIIDAFYYGYSFISNSNWDFVVKLDGDLVLEPDYFEKCFAEFAQDPKLGIGGGVVGHLNDGTLHIENNPMFHVRGATKIYRRECWHSLGGLLKAPGWDTVDELKANMLGWTTRSFPDIQLLQRRPTGATNTAWGNWVKNGRANYIAGYHPLFMFAKCAGRFSKKPYVIGATGLMYGFLSCYFTRTSRVPDRDLIRYVRRQQLRRLFLLDSIWR